MGGEEKRRKMELLLSLTCIISYGNIISIFLGKQKAKNYAT